MVTHTQNLCSAFHPSKCKHTAVSSEHTVNTHQEHWAAIFVAAPGISWEFGALLKGRTVQTRPGCMDASSISSKTLISCFRCVYLGLELNHAGHRALQDWVWTPLLKDVTSVILLRVERVLIIHFPHLQSLPDLRLEPMTFGLQVQLSNH